MIAATNESRLAFIDVISESGYTLGIYESAAHRHRSDATEFLSLDGSPNAADIVAALGAGWTPSQDIPTDPPVPKAVTARQIRLWLISNGKSLAAIDAAISSIPDARRREAVRVEWEYAAYVERSHPMLVPLGAALAMTPEQIDAAFVEAARM